MDELLQNSAVSAKKPKEWDEDKGNASCLLMNSLENMHRLLYNGNLPPPLQHHDRITTNQELPHTSVTTRTSEE